MGRQQIIVVFLPGDSDGHQEHAASSSNPIRSNV
jgi:hypothetical protein